MRHPLALIAVPQCHLHVGAARDRHVPAGLSGYGGSLGAAIDDIEASISIFLLGYAISQLLFGPLSDRYGRRAMLVVGIVLFVAGSVLSGLATGIDSCMRLGAIAESW